MREDLFVGEDSVRQSLCEEDEVGEEEDAFDVISGEMWEAVRGCVGGRPELGLADE